MSKKNYIYIGIALLVLIISAIAFTKFFSSNYAAKTSFQAISSRASSFVYTQNLESLKLKMDSASYMKTLQESNSLNSFYEHVSFIDSVLQQIENNFSLPYKNVVFQPNNVGSSTIGFLTIAEFNESLSAAKVLDLLKNEGFQTSKYDYKNYTIYTVQKFANQKDFSFVVFNNLWLASANTPQIEEALNALNANDGKNNNALFQELYKKVKPDADFVVFTDHSASDNFSQLLFSSSFLETQKRNTESSDWTAYTFTFNEKNIGFEGHFATKNPAESDFTTIANTESAGLEILNFLPNNTAYFEAISSKNNISFQSNSHAYSYFKDWLNEEATFFILETFDEAYNKRAGLILKTISLDSAKVNLYMLNKEMSPVQDYDGTAIYEMNAEVLSKIFHSKIITLEKPFFAFVKNYIVFANDINVVKTVLEKYSSKAFLSKNVDFKTQIDLQANKVVYLNPQLMAAPLQSIFKENEFPIGLGKYFISYTSENDNIYAKGTINFEQEVRKKTNNIWNVELDTISYFTPQIVLNEESLRKEIFVQDLNNTIYVLSQAGDILLKTNFVDKIMSEVHQIDLYKANKLFYVFNTKDKIYALKKDGSLVDGYPIKLPDDASNSVLVVNYDKDKNYRLFIACQNNKVYAYQANGKPLPGWSPQGEPGRVTAALKYAIYDGKDYIFFNTIAGTFYGLDRKGNNRFEPVGLDAPFKNGFEATKDGFSGISNGSMYTIDLKGKATVKILGDSSYNTFTNYTEKEAFAVANNNEIRIAKSKWTLLGKKLLNDVVVSIKKLELNKKTWFLVNCQNSIYLVNEMGEIHKDFPVLSNSEAKIETIYDNKTNLLIFIEGKRLRVFELAMPN